MQSLNKNLSGMYQDSTSDTAIDILFERDDFAGKLDEKVKEMNDFTYIVSHDLQAPLRMVTGFLDLLEKRHAPNLEDGAKKYIDYAVKGAAKMQALLNDLLVYSRLSSIPQVIELIDLNEIFVEVRTKLEPKIIATAATINAEQLPGVYGDRKQLTQLFIQLIDNALKYKSGTAPIINISSSTSGETITVKISDNGIGIDAAFQEKVFSIFRRLHNDDEKFSGTGAGLAFCKKIVELHHGRIWIESEKEKGSTIAFTLSKNES